MPSCRLVLVSSRLVEEFSSFFLSSCKVCHDDCILLCCHTEQDVCVCAGFFFWFGFGGLEFVGRVRVFFCAFMSFFLWGGGGGLFWKMVFRLFVCLFMSFLAFDGD